MIDNVLIYGCLWLCSVLAKWQLALCGDDAVSTAQKQMLMQKQVSSLPWVEVRFGIMRVYIAVVLLFAHCLLACWLNASRR